MLNMLLSGCNGRMGSVVSRICAERSDIAVIAGLDIVTRQHFGYPVYADPAEFTGKAEVAVDFSSPGQLSGLLSFCLEKKCPLVLCTTGYSQEQNCAINNACGEIPIFRSGNMSLGIYLLMDLAKRASGVLGGFDIEIIEKHHNKKLDAPSGTAIMLYDALSENLAYDPEPIYDRHQLRQERKGNEIGLHTVRGGTIVGEHEIIFAGRDEVVTLSHSASSREVFASGAVYAALFLAKGQPPGMYSMQDIIAPQTAP
ncbi:MAG: 4-hydroxy-tetrahydrodipicolinate reductase [Oscillospiraceae bacterium]|nr:4-hydroxy-tetrahydrodipicolinate reductase [Oscillospiraceae bacterium]